MLQIEACRRIRPRKIAAHDHAFQARARKAVRFVSMATPTLPTRASLNLKAKIGQTIPNKHLRIRSLQDGTVQQPTQLNVAHDLHDGSRSEDEDDDAMLLVADEESCTESEGPVLDFIHIGAFIATESQTDAPFWLARVERVGSTSVFVTWYDNVNSANIYSIEQDYEGSAQEVDATAILAVVTDLVTTIDDRTIDVDIDSVPDLFK